jgi:hypothetical protein
MNCAHNTMRTMLACGALCALLSGCRRDITAPNAAPNISPGTNRQGMIQWHQQHDKLPAVPAPGR